MEYGNIKGNLWRLDLGFMSANPLLNVMERSMRLVLLFHRGVEVTAVDVMEELMVSRSTASKYIRTASVLMPICEVGGYGNGGGYGEPTRYRLMDRR